MAKHTQPKEDWSQSEGTMQVAKPAELGAEKLTPEEQRQRFVKAVREAEASEDGAAVDANRQRIARPRKPDAA